jgi:lactoylglutathione lyase
MGGRRIFRFKDTFIALRHDASDVVSLAEKGVGQFAIEVEDVDAVRAELEEHGVTVISGPADRDWGMRTLTFADPGGYTWGVAQDLPSADAS